MAENPWVALHAPVAPHTWSLSALLAGNQEETGIYPLRFNWPTEIVGFLPTVVVHNNSEFFTVPTVADVLVSYGANQGERWYSHQFESSDILGSGRMFVDLAAVSVQVPRLVRIVLPGAQEMAFAFRWKRWSTLGQLYENALITLNVFARRLTAQSAAELLREQQE